MSEELVLAVPLPSEADISQRIGPFYDAARTLNAVKMLAGAGDLATPAIDLMHAIFKTAVVDAKTRELIILRTAKAAGCEYALRAGPAGHLGAALQIVVRAAIFVWAIDEVWRGVNPWRRCLGAGVLGYELAAML